MIIADLNYIEVVSEETSISGGTYKKYGASAVASAVAGAIGVKFAATETYTETLAIFGGKKGGAAASSISYSASVAG